MERAIEDVFRSLQDVRWDVAHRTYGSSHATLIGLLVEWWIRLSPSHTVLDGPPSHGFKNAGQGDAMFLENGVPVGVLEAEGTQPLAKVQTIAKYFDTVRSELTTIRFGVLLQYAYEPFGRGAAKAYRPAEVVEVIDAAKAVTAERPDRSIIAIALDKSYSPPVGVRTLASYYSGTANKITGILLRGGIETARQTFFEAESAPVL